MEPYQPHINHLWQLDTQDHARGRVPVTANEIYSVSLRTNLGVPGSYVSRSMFGCSGLSLVASQAQVKAETQCTPSDTLLSSLDRQGCLGSTPI